MKRIYLRDTIFVALHPLLSLERKISVRAKTFSLFLFSFLIAWTVQSQNSIVTENALPGNPKSEWDVSNSGDPSIQGFATEMSVNKGSTIRFKINVTGTNRNYSINIYRLGYYQGNGARLVASLGTFSGVVQPNPIVDGTLGLADCGNWSESASWAVPSSAVSGIYIAKLTRSDNGGSSHITFVVRDDAANSSVLFKTADATWQAYNSYGGSSFYFGTTSNPEGRASKVSYNRPFNTRSIKAECFLFNAEYPMLRWLERNGYDMTYTTDVDMERNTTLITPSKHKVLLSVGHDEYWSAGQRNSFENARNAGVHLSFFSGNEVYWKVRWENNTRTLVCYKEGTGSQGEFTCGGNCDPLAGVWTGLWRYGCEYGEDGCQPENALTGQLSWTESNAAIQVPYEFRNLSFWRNTSIATLSPGQTATLTASTLGYEWNYEQPAFASFNPPGRITLSSTTVADKTHKLSLYTHSSGAIVFGAGTVQWSWGLDNVHDREQPAISRDMQQATLNLFLDMGVAPGSPQSNLIISGYSGDLTPPVSAITSPVNGSNATINTPVTISGTASDNTGISRIEVSTDGGNSWQSANGTTNWSYIWTPLLSGTITVKSRAIDVAGNIEAQGTAPSSNAINVTVAGGGANNCPCTIFTNQLPGIANQRDNTIGIVLGTRFISSTDGSVTALRFYKGAGNTGTHTGQLWSSTGTLLAQATFTNETASGWQQVTLGTPVAITAGVSYIVSYHSSDGYYSVSENFFANSVTNGPLTAPADASGANNGLYIYSSTPGFPNLTYNKQNYFVDVVLSTTIPTDETAPTVVSTNPGGNASGVATNTSVTAVFSESLNPSFVNGTNVFLRNGANGVSATVSYTPGSQNVILTPSAPLAGETLYTVTLKGGTGGIRDIAGNVLVNDYTWNFTTAPAPVATPPMVVSTTPAANATNVATTTTITTVFNEPLLASSITGTNVYLRYGTTSVSATLSYTAGSTNVVLTPSAALVADRLYTVTLRGGSTGIKDIEGNAMVSNYSFSFTVAPIARRGSATTARSTTTSLLIAKPSGVVQNDIMIVNIASRGNNIAPVSSGWTLLRSSALGGSNIRFGSVLYKIAGASEPTSYTFALGTGSTGGAGAILAFSGVDVTNPFDVAPGNIASATATAVTASAITTVTPNSALLFLGQAAGTNGGASITWSNSAFRTATSPGALTELYDNQQTTIRASVGAAWAFKPTGGSTGAGSATITTAVANGGILVALRPKSQSTTDNIPPTVMSTTPVSNATGVAVNSSITAVVSESLLASSVNSASVLLRAGTTSVPATVSYTSGSTSIVLTPSSPLNAGTVYTVTLKGGTATDRIRDLAGNALTADYTWNFTTVQPDNIAPTVLSTSPVSNATGVAASVNINAVFSESLSASTVSNATAFIESNAGLVPATVSYVTGSTSLTLIPSSPLNPGTVYTVTLKGGTGADRITDVSGNPLANDYTWSFTVAEVDNTPPTIISTSPASNATDVATNGNITVVVSESLLASSVNTSSVFIERGTTSVPASVSYISGTANIILTPSSSLLAGTVYTVTVKGGTGTNRIRDLSDNALETDYIWSFTTAPDNIAPVSIISSPANGATISVNQPVNITGTASDAGGLSRVEISVDGGTTWQNATGTSNWSYSWTPSVTGIYTIKSRGVDNSGNTEPAENGPASNVISLTVSAIIANPCPCTIFSGTQPIQPTGSILKNDGSALAIGTKFSTNANGYITGLRFYKASGNTGTHIGQLYTVSGSLLAQATFTNETASGWQQVNLTSPVAVTAGTVYIVSYHSSAGNYSTTNNYFTTAVVNGPLRGLADGENGGNGLYRYNATPAVPNATYLASNYWVDVEFNTVLPQGSGISAQESSILDARFGNAQNFNQAAINNKLTFVLTQNAPNPSSGRTIIRYTVPVKTHVYLGLYDMQGRQVRVMVNEMKAAGEQQFELDTRTLGKGVYYYKMKADGFIGTKRLVVE